jgi:hypothetical protein
MSNFTAIEVDVRDLEPPLPMQEVLSRVPELSVECYIKMIHRQEPKLLFDILNKRGCKFISRQFSEDEWNIYIYLNFADEIEKELL